MRITDYISGVQSGEIVTGRLVQLAIERHLRDIERSNAGELPYIFDERLAANIIEIFPVLFRHYKGKWKGQAFVLEPWQEFCVASLLAWIHPETKLRRFRKAYLSMGRKNGKTFLAACIGTLHAIADHPPENAPEVYCTASKYDQARIVFDDIRAMVNQSDELQRFLKVWQNAITHDAMNGSIKALGADRPFSGLNPSFVIKDEIHELRSRHREFSDTMSTGGAARAQPIELIITTAGDDESEIWIEEVEYAERVLEDVIQDDTLFALIYCLDKDDEPLDESNWPKANPNIDGSVSREYLIDQAHRARNDQTARHRFLRYHGNVKTTSRPRAIDRDKWKSLYSDEVPLASTNAHGGIDVGRVYDFCSWSVVMDLGDENYAIKSRSYTTEDRAKGLRTSQISQWISEGWLIEHPGNAVDFRAVFNDVIAAHRQYGVKNWAADPSFAAVFLQWLVEYLGEDSVYEFRQSAGHYEPSVSAFMLAIEQGRIVHDGDPCLAWQMYNMAYKMDAAGRRMPDKGGAGQFKIDAGAATIMAVGGSVFDGSIIRSVYDEGESLLL